MRNVGAIFFALMTVFMFSCKEANVVKIDAPYYSERGIVLNGNLPVITTLVNSTESTMLTENDEAYYLCDHYKSGIDSVLVESIFETRKNLVKKLYSSFYSQDSVLIQKVLAEMIAGNKFKPLSIYGNISQSYQYISDSVIVDLNVYKPAIYRGKGMFRLQVSIKAGNVP